MSAIKDVIDLITQLVEKVEDRKQAEELRNVLSMVANIQAEQANLHERNIALGEENLGLKGRIQRLEGEIKELSSTSLHSRDNIPTCPNCSTSANPFYMRPRGPRFAEVSGATHECPKCKYAEKFTT